MSVMMETAAPEPFIDEIRAFEQADAQSMPAPGQIVFLGSSSIQGWSNLARDFSEFKVLNRGFGGSIIAHSTHYAPRIVWPLKPRLIVFYAGDNDLAEGKTPTQVLADFQEFAQATRQNLPATSLAFVAIKPSPSRAHLKAEAMRANALIREFIEARHGAKMRFVDVWTAMTDDAGVARPELLGPDDLHMNARGYKLWTQILTPHLHAILDSDFAAPSK